MEGSVLRRTIRNSELVIPKDKRSFLTFPVDGLAGCVLEEEDDGVTLEFETTGLAPAETVLSRSAEDQFRFLANCAALVKLDDEYSFSMSLDNLLVDINLKPLVLVRDARGGGGTIFLSRYQALVGSVVQRRYGYDDYLGGGRDLYKKNALLAQVAASETVSEVEDRLRREFQSITEKDARTMRLVPKRNVWASRVAIPVLAAALVAAGFFAGVSMFRDIPYKDDVIQANTAYIAGDYIGAQQALQDYAVTGLSYESKYLLSRAYVGTEALTDTQKDNILIGLTLKTDPVIFDYWIYLGRMDFDAAIDIALRLDDDELLLFAYMKYEVVVRNDTMMTGEEKTALLTDLGGKIDAIQQTRAEESGQAGDSDADQAGDEATGPTPTPR